MRHFAESAKKIKVEKEIKYFILIRLVIRILLYVSILSLTISLIATLICGAINTYSLNYFSVFFSSYSVFLSFTILIIIALYKITKNQIVWKIIEKESILVLIAIFGLIILGIITNYISKY